MGVIIVELKKKGINSKTYDDKLVPFCWLVGFPMKNPCQKSLICVYSTMKYNLRRLWRQTAPQV